ncbi:MAG TPA: hypothetical protein PLZ40_11330 [Ferruginibacter sp.]|nr:hypothetical protein [Ferruginibacter sp.]
MRFGCMLLNTAKVRKSDSFISLSQYPVSCVSFSAIDSFVIKSFFDIPYNPSFTLAPIEVPDINTCLLNTNSLLLSIKYL